MYVERDLCAMSGFVCILLGAMGVDVFVLVSM